MRQKILWAFLMVVFTIGLAGCTSHSTNPHPNALAKLGFELESNDLATLVTRVTLTVISEGPPIDTLSVDELNLVDGVVTDTVTLVSDQMITLILNAYGSSGVLLYTGDTTFVVPTTESFPVDILLAPPPDLLMLRAGPLYQAASLEGDTISVFVDVHNATNLFGAGFRLLYDPDALQFVDATVGDFVPGDPPVPTLGGTFGFETAGSVPFSVTRLGNAGDLPPGVTGTGRLATFRFTPLLSGPTDLTIGAETVKLTQPSGDNIPLLNNLVLESATVDVQ